ncbi:MAG: TetR/AcrR family transcriptional regulator [Rhodoglobus sp.]
MSEPKSPPLRGRAPRGQARARLVDAAGELFSENGVSGTSLQAIADHMGVTKAAVYHQFSSKTEIVIAVAEPVIDQLRSIAETASALTGNAARVACIEGLVDLALEHKGIAALVRQDPAVEHILSAYEPYRAQLARIDSILLGNKPTPQRRIALAFAGAGIMAVGSLAGLGGETPEFRSALIDAMYRALDTGD